MLAHVPSFGRNPRGSPDFLAYPVPKACMHVLGTGVPRCLGVARSASSPKAAQALGCSLTPGLRISFGRVTCMARGASVPGLWTLGFLLLRGACVWVWVVVGFGFRLRPATPGWGVGVCVRLCVHSACTLPLLARVRGVGVCGWVRVPAAPRHSWLGCRGVCVLVCLLLLYPAFPGWRVRLGCVCLGLGFGCAPRLLAGVLGCVCARVRAPLAPRHSWLGCPVWVCVFGLGFRLRPATPGWGVGLCVCSCARSACTQPLLARVRGDPATPGMGARCGCVCLGSGFSCAPPLLAGVLGCVCARLRAPLAPSHSWHGCAVTQPLLERVRGVGVCVWAPVSAAPRQSWLGCWGVCVLVCLHLLYPASPGWGVRLGSVCLGSGFGCAPPLLAGLLGCVCARVRAPLAPSHSWLGCAVWVCVFGLGSRLRPATPGWGVGPCVCSCARSACTQPVLARVRGDPATPGMGPRCGCVYFGLGFRLRPATPGWGVGLCLCWCVRSACTQPLLAPVRGDPATPGRGAWCGCVCLGSGFSCAPPLLAGVLGCVCARVRAPLAPSHSWHGCAVTQPLLPRVRGVGVCVWVRVSAPPRHSWLGFWGVCVLVCLHLLYPASPGWGVRRGCVCLGSGFGCAPPLLAWLLGCVCARVRAPLAPSHSWLGCAVWVCVFGLGSRLRPATPGWDVGPCVCSCARSACTQPLLARVRGDPATPGTGARCGCVCLGSGFGCAPPLLAGMLGCVCVRVRAPLAASHSWHGCAVTKPLLARVRGVGVCVWARVSAAPRHSWLGCWAVCVLVCALHLHPATPGTGAR